MQLKTYFFRSIVFWHITLKLSNFINRTVVLVISYCREGQREVSSNGAGKPQRWTPPLLLMLLLQQPNLGCQQINRNTRRWPSIGDGWETWAPRIAYDFDPLVVQRSVDYGNGTVFRCACVVDPRHRSANGHPLVFSEFYRHDRHDARLPIVSDVHRLRSPSDTCPSFLSNGTGPVRDERDPEFGCPCTLSSM